MWSDGFTTSVENQAAFIIPNNKYTKEIDYNKRFMLTDNEKRPKVYEVTKLMDTFPPGNIKVTLSQDHYNEYADLCGKDDYFDDGKMHMICDFYNNPTSPNNENKDIDDLEVTWNIEGKTDKLYIHGSELIMRAIPSIDTAERRCKWGIRIIGDPKDKEKEKVYYKPSQIKKYFTITPETDDYEMSEELTIRAINNVMAKYLVIIELYDSIEDGLDEEGNVKMKDIVYDSVEMEVVI